MRLLSYLPNRNIFSNSVVNWPIYLMILPLLAAFWKCRWGPGLWSTQKFRYGALRGETVELCDSF